MWFYSWVLQKNSWTHQTKLIISHLYLLMISPDITHIWNSYHISYMINASLQLAIEILQPCTEPSIWQLIRQTEEVTAKSKIDFLWIWIICRHRFSQKWQLRVCKWNFRVCKMLFLIKFPMKMKDLGWFWGVHLTQLPVQNTGAQVAG